MFDHQIHQTTIFSDRFKALWEHIIDTIKDNDTIHSIKEHTHTVTKKQYTEYCNNDIYMVNQLDKFVISLFSILPKFFLIKIIFDNILCLSREILCIGKLDIVPSNA